MPNEQTIAANLAYSDGVSGPVELVVDGLLQSVATKVSDRGQQSIATAETPLGKGSVGTIGYYMLVNLDPTNFVTVKNQASGKAVHVLKPGGGCCLGYAGADMQSMVLVADTAACVIDKLICSQ